MRPILFTLGPMPIYSFGLMVTLAFLAGAVVMHCDFARKGEPRRLAWEGLAFAVLGGLVGARLHYGFENWQSFTEAPLRFLVSTGGLVWYGGLAGGVLATVWPIRRAGVAWASAMDSGAPAWALGLAIGRIGCHLSGDGDWGTPTDLPWAVAYPNGIAPWPHAPGVEVHPAALYELFALLAIFAVLWRLRTRVTRRGSVFAIYLVLTGIARFLVEIVRTNEPILLGLTEAQCISVAVVVAAAVWLVRHRASRDLSVAKNALDS